MKSKAKSGKINVVLPERFIRKTKANQIKPEPIAAIAKFKLPFAY